MNSKLFKFTLLTVALLCLSTKCTKDPEDPPADSSYEMNAEFTINPPSGSIETEFEFDASNSFLRNNGGENVFYINDLMYRWDFNFVEGYDPDWDEENENKKVTTHKYDQSGTYNVLFELAWVHYEGHDLMTKQSIATIVVGFDNEPPHALISITPEWGYPNWTTFYIHGNLSWDEEDGMQLSEFLWDKDGDGTYDGDFSSESEFSQSYEEPGIYEIKLKVRDSGGSTGETEEIVVVVGPGGEPCTVQSQVLHGGETYETVQIGDQCWLKRNLNIGTYTSAVNPQTNNDQIEKYCFDNDFNNCEDHGGLYQWDEMMNYNTSSLQGICPEDWHIPTDEDWKILEGTIDSQYGVGDPHWDEEGEWRGSDLGYNLKHQALFNGYDTHGFKGLMGGYYTGIFFNYLASGHYWTSTSTSNYIAWTRKANNSNGFVSREDEPKTDAYRVRCIRN